MTVQSLKTSGQSNLDLECTQALKMGRSYLRNKMVNIIFFFKSCSPLTLNKHRMPEDDILNHFCCNEEK